MGLNRKTLKIFFVFLITSAENINPSNKILFCCGGRVFGIQTHDLLFQEPGYSPEFNQENKSKFLAQYNYLRLRTIETYPYFVLLEPRNF